MATILEGRGARPTSQGATFHPTTGGMRIAHPVNRRRRPVSRAPREMTREEICNVEPVTAAELRSVLDGMGVCEADERWTLTLEGLV